MNNNYFGHTSDNPYHLSVGAVVKNNKGEVCCHYFDKFFHKSFGDFENFYLLMRETPEPGETLEETLNRGLLEEFGMEATLNRYIGSIISHFSKKEKIIEKTTLYFLCDFISLDELKRKKDDPEASSEIRWLAPSELILKMKEQGIRLHRSDIDESVILERI